MAFGEVVEEAMMLGVEGHLWLTFELDTGVITTSSLDGQVVADLCALLD